MPSFKKFADGQSVSWRTNIARGPDRRAILCLIEMIANGTGPFTVVSIRNEKTVARFGNEIDGYWTDPPCWTQHPMELDFDPRWGSHPQRVTIRSGAGEDGTFEVSGFFLEHYNDSKDYHRVYEAWSE